MKRINIQFKILYAIGILFIVSGHYFNGGINFFFDWFKPYAFHVGLFVFCSGYFYQKENEENAAWILNNLPFKKKEIASVLPEVLKSDCVENQIQLLPGIHPCDGFFIAAFEKEV